MANSYDIPHENFVITYGKEFKDKKLSDINLVRLDKYLEWLESLDRPGRKLLEAKEKISEYLDHTEVAEQLERELEGRGKS